MEIAVTGSSDDEELAALVRRVRGGHSGAFDELARRVRGRVRDWARRVVGDDDDAEDVAQLVLVRVHERIAEFEERSRFGTWLYRITRNVALERMRVDARRSALLSRRIAEAGEAPEADTSDATDADRLRRLVARCFNELTPRQREVFDLIELRGVPAPEVAARLAIDQATVRVLLLRARRAIRSRMLEQHPDLLEGYRS